LLRKIKAPAWPLREKSIVNVPARFPSLQSIKLPRPLCAAGYFLAKEGLRWIKAGADQTGILFGFSRVDLPGRNQMTRFSTDRLPSWGWRIVIALVVFAIAMFLFGPKAFSQDTGRGEQLAKTWCVSCHSIDSKGTALRNDAVPSLAAISMRPDTSQKSLESFLQSKHPRMPAYSLKQKETRDVAAYIVSLNPAASKPNQGRTRP
jgi:mono/diheme cytochrome c family protein